MGKPDSSTGDPSVQSGCTQDRGPLPDCSAWGPQGPQEGQHRTRAAPRHTHRRVEVGRSFKERENALDGGCDT